MSETIDDETGEVIETTEPEASETPPQTLSERAAAGITPPPYWRRVNAIEGDGGPAYELAFFNAQGEIDAIIEADAVANVTTTIKNKYATLAGLLARVRPILTKHRLTIKQFPGRVHRLGSDATKQMFLPICTCLTHVDSGQGETFIWEMPVNKIDPQALGSLSTYGRRYAIAGIFGIATVDDDAAAASIKNKIDREQGADIIDTLIADINAMKTLADLKKWLATHREGIEGFAEDKVEKLRAAYAEKLAALQQDNQDKPETGKKK